MKDPINDVHKAWNGKRVTMKVVGLLASDEPLLDEKTGFYITSLGCEASEDNLNYAKIFNNEIRKLVLENGRPEGAPINHRPTRNDAMKMLNSGIPVEDFSWLNEMN